jgi:hypothetical protein
MIPPTTFFSATITEADQKFADAAGQADADLVTVLHPLPGPGGEPLHVSIARVGATPAAQVLLVMSGTHGIEGFAGAGIQTGVLRSLERFDLRDDTALLLIHLINPWGAAWNRREDHENIDPFRNFLYCDDPVTPDPLYDAIDDLWDLAHFADRSADENAALRTEALRRFGSEARLIAAVRRGQHHRPRGMTYHGQAPCWSRQVLEAQLRQHLAGCRRLAVLDIHTGFGAYGDGLVMSYDPVGDPRQQRIRRWTRGPIYLPGGDADIPPHRKSPYGFIADWVAGVSVTAAILEFGTLDPNQHRELFPANHYYHVYGNPLSDEGRRVGAQYRRYCYPEEPGWIESVWRRGAEVTGAMLAGLGPWASETP